MAEAKTEEPPKKKGKLLLFIIIGVVVVAIGAVAAILLMKKHPAEDGEDGEAAPAKVEKEKEKKKPAQVAPPAYVKLDTFTSNLATDGNDPQGAQYIQVVVELKVEDAHEGEALKPFTPEIRNAILRLLSSRKSSQLTTTEGKDKLAEDIRGAVNTIVNPPKRAGTIPEEPVQAVLFSNFIIQ